MAFLLVYLGLGGLQRDMMRSFCPLLDAGMGPVTSVSCKICSSSATKDTVIGLLICRMQLFVRGGC